MQTDKITLSQLESFLLKAPTFCAARWTRPSSRSLSLAFCFSNASPTNLTASRSNFAGARNGAAVALEEDARLTVLFLCTQQNTDSEDIATATTGDEEDEGDEEDATTSEKGKGGMSLPFDVARRFAQPLGIHLAVWEHRVIGTEKGVVRLLPVTERARQVFGEQGADTVASELEQSPLSTRNLQLSLFPEGTGVPAKGRRRKNDVADQDLQTQRSATILDRVHTAMLLAYPR